MKKLIGLILMLVLSVYLILMFINMSDDYDKISYDVSFTAVENTSTGEILYVNELIFEITDIHIDGVHQNIDDVILSINTIHDGSITLVNNATNIGDLIEISYIHIEPSSEFTSDFVNVVPLIMIIIIVGGFGYAIFKFN